MLTCKNLRGAVLTSGLLLIAAWIVEMFATSALFPTVPTAYAGFLLIVAAVAVLVGTFMLSLLPANARRLSGCEH
jgi:hypothetical protein